MTATSRREAENARTAARQLHIKGDPAWLDESGEDQIWTIEDICEIFDVTKNVVYKLNATKTIRYRHFGKHCRYLRSDVLSYFMGREPGEDGEFKRLPLDELPRIFARKRGVRQSKPKKPKEAAVPV